MGLFFLIKATILEILHKGFVFLLGGVTGSNGGGGDGGGELQLRRAESDGLGRQSSLSDLTLDEVQHQLGDLEKPLSSMNLDDLLKSVWTTEINMNVDYSHLVNMFWVHLWLAS
ncbi:putative plant bZIP transcription factor [Helianthus anomalus]